VFKLYVLGCIVDQDSKSSYYIHLVAALGPQDVFP
jgi:hypothetical protein